MKRLLLPALLVGAFAFGSTSQADAYTYYYGGYYGYPTVRYSSPHSYYYGRSPWQRYDRYNRYSRYDRHDRYNRYDRRDRYDRHRRW